MTANAQRSASPNAANRLLQALSSTARSSLIGCAKTVQLKPDEQLCSVGDRVRHVYFPTGALISLSTPFLDKRSIAVGLLGDEGMLGIWTILGPTEAPLRANVQNAGPAWRVDVATFHEKMREYAPLRHRLEQYLYVTLAQRTQAAACACFHKVEQRLARWLLMTRDRAHCDELHITHEYLAGVLGVRRAGVTSAALSLQARKLIRYSRGDIRILDGVALQTAACDCYAADCKSYSDRMERSRSSTIPRPLNRIPS